MIKINKGIAPREWADYCRTPGVQYQAVPELRDALYKAQGYICAYCMRRIPVRDNNSNEDHRIDHIKCRKKHPADELHYSNMVICCPGAINGDPHCDKKKRDNDVTFDLFSDQFIQTLSYSTNTGEIKSTNSTWNDEINRFLNLNNSLLKANRRKVIASIIEVFGERKWKKREVKEQLKSWENLDEDGKYKPYCGVAIWFLKKTLPRL